MYHVQSLIYDVNSMPDFVYAPGGTRAGFGLVDRYLLLSSAYNTENNTTVKFSALIWCPGVYGK